MDAWENDHGRVEGVLVLPGVIGGRNCRPEYSEADTWEVTEGEGVPA